MSIIKHTAVISASPKPSENSASGFLAHYAEAALRGDGIDVRIINVRESLTKNQTAKAFAYMAGADALVIIFPLYIFCLPAILMRFLQQYREYAASLPDNTQNPVVYAVVNCGFPEPEINREAVRVIGSFSEKIGAEFRFGVMIGGGGMISGAKESPMVRKMLKDVGAALERMKREIVSGGRGSADNVLTRVRIPRRFYYFMGNMSWRMLAWKNGLKRKDLYAQPYMAEN